METSSRCQRTLRPCLRDRASFANITPLSGDVAALSPDIAPPSRNIGRGAGVGQWPGVHCAQALIEGKPLEGYWFDRTRESAARRRGETFGKYEYATAETVELDPLPCWSHLPVEEQRRRVASLVRSIDEQAAARRQAAGIRPLGVAAVLAQVPVHRPGKIKKSPSPFVHAATKAIRQFLWEGYASFAAAYRSAAERLKAGDPTPPFPVGCFPPALPFVAGREESPPQREDRLLGASG